MRDKENARSAFAGYKIGVPLKTPAWAGTVSPFPVARGQIVLAAKRWILSKPELEYGGIALTGSKEAQNVATGMACPFCRNGKIL